MEYPKVLFILYLVIAPAASFEHYTDHFYLKKGEEADLVCLGEGDGNSTEVKWSHQIPTVYANGSAIIKAVDGEDRVF